MTALLTACAGETVRPPVDPATFDERDAVVFVHGYYGSALREKDNGPREFIRVSTVLMGSFPIGLASAELETLPSRKMEVEGMILSVPVVPGIYGVDVYGELLNKLARPSLQVIPFSYDWRGDLPTAAAQLGNLISRLQAAGSRRITIFAHSMGGLVTAYYLAYGDAQPENAQANWTGARQVSAVAFFGTPFHGVASILRNMQHGTGYPWNEDLLRAGTVASFPASYQLVPLDFAVLTPEGSGETLDISQASTWESKKMGLFRDAPSGALPARRRYTEAQVSRAARVQALLRNMPPRPPLLQVLNVRGSGQPTLAKAYLHEGRLVFLPKEAKRAGLPFAPLEAPGDGTVTADSARLPAALAAGAVEVGTTFEHQKLFLDPQAEKEYEKLLSQPD